MSNTVGFGDVRQINLERKRIHLNDKINSYGNGLVNYASKVGIRRISKPIIKSKPLRYARVISRSIVTVTGISA